MNTAKDFPCQSQIKLSLDKDSEAPYQFFLAEVIVVPERSNFSFELFDGPQNIVHISYSSPAVRYDMTPNITKGFFTPGRANHRSNFCLEDRKVCNKSLRRSQSLSDQFSLRATFPMTQTQGEPARHGGTGRTEHEYLFTASRV